MKTPSIISFVYGALLILGGIMGFVMARSIDSLITGVGSGVLMLVAGSGFKKLQNWALPLGLVVSLAVGAFFFSNISKSSQSPTPTGTTAEMEKTEKKRKSAHTRAIGMTALSALTLIGLLATGRRKD